MKNKNTFVLALLMVFETINQNSTRAFIVLSCVIYTIIENYVFIYYTACQSKKLSDNCIDRKYSGKSFNELLGIYIPYLLMNLFSCYVS